MSYLEHPLTPIAGFPTNHVAVETPWQVTSLSTKGMSGDLFWQHGDVLSTGRTHDDTNTIYYGSSEWDGLVVQHQARIKASASNPNPGTPPPASSTTTKPTTTTPSPSTKPITPTPSPPGNVQVKWGQCGGENWSGPKVCVPGTVCTFNNQWYSQCL